MSSRTSLVKNGRSHLLVDVSVPRSPTIRGVAARHAIDARLRVDRQEASLVELRERLGDRGGLLRARLVGPRERLEISTAEPGEEGGDVGQGGGVAPEARGVGRTVRQCERERVEVAERRRGLVAPGVGRVRAQIGPERREGTDQRPFGNSSQSAVRVT